MSDLHNTKICVSPLSNRIVLARFGKDPNVALESRDAMNEFLQAIAQYAFDGEMPAPGEKVEVRFGGGDEQFILHVERVSFSQAPSQPQEHRKANDA
jgi:hypothetical protein